LRDPAVGCAEKQKTLDYFFTWNPQEGAVLSAEDFMGRLKASGRLD
jgi:hypothetical protein